MTLPFLQKASQQPWLQQSPSFPKQNLTNQLHAPLLNIEEKGRLREKQKWPKLWKEKEFKPLPHNQSAALTTTTTTLSKKKTPTPTICSLQLSKGELERDKLMTENIGGEEVQQTGWTTSEERRKTKKKRKSRPPKPAQNLFNL